MGPRFFNRGITPVEAGTSANPWLQWGRGSSTAESAQASELVRQSARFNGAAVLQPRNRAYSEGTLNLSAHASMGPRFFSRGIATTLFDETKAMVASMGPRFFNRGIRRHALPA